MELTWGSCFGLRDKTTDIFKKIGFPDLFMWGGDVTYSDSIAGGVVSEFFGGEFGMPIDHIKKKYKQAKYDYPGY